MQLCLTTYNQEQHKFDFTTTLYQAVTVAMEGKEIVINLDTGQVDNRVIDREGEITTAEIAAKFEQHQKRRGLAKITMASYRSVLVALADVAPEWPPRIEDIEVLFDSYRTKKRSPVTLSEYWVRLNTWFKWAWEMGYIGSNPMRQVTRPELPHIEAGVISPKDFIKVIKHLRQVIDVTEPRQRSLPHERAVRDLAIIRFTYSTGLRVGEVAGLKMDDLDLPNQIVTIRGDTSKGKKTRDVCVGKQACRSLEDWLKIRP